MRSEDTVCMHCFELELTANASSAVSAMLRLHPHYAVGRHTCATSAVPANMASRLEINFIRLLSRCETIASEKRGETEWRLEKVRTDKLGMSVIAQRGCSLTFVS